MVEALQTEEHRDSKIKHFRDEDLADESNAFHKQFDHASNAMKKMLAATKCMTIAIGVGFCQIFLWIVNKLEVLIKDDGQLPTVAFPMFTRRIFIYACDPVAVQLMDKRIDSISFQ